MQGTVSLFLSKYKKIESDVTLEILTLDIIVFLGLSSLTE